MHDDARLLALLLCSALCACTLHADIHVDANGDDESTSDSGPAPGDPCDPLVGDCPPHQLCMPEPPGSGEFRCEDDTDPQEGHIGDPCVSEHGCAPTLGCAPGSMVEGCPAGACCTPLCHHADPDGCLPHLQCEVFPDIAGPDIGVCVCMGGSCDGQPPPAAGTLWVGSEADDLWRIDLATHAGGPIAPDTVGIADVIIGFDGSVYAADPGADLVRRFDVDGVEHPPLFPPGDGGLDGPTGLATDGMRLYIASHGTDQIMVMHLPGGPVVPLTIPGDGGLHQPQDVAIAPGNRLYVASAQPDQVLAFDDTGAFDGVVAPPHPELQGASGVWVMADGWLFVSSRDNDRVLGYDPMGILHGDLNAGVVPRPWGLAAIGEEQLFVAGDGIVAQFTLGGMPGQPHEVFAAPPQSTGIALIP
jgi:hypothetical protein